MKFTLVQLFVGIFWISCLLGMLVMTGVASEILMCIPKIAYNMTIGAFTNEFYDVGLPDTREVSFIAGIFILASLFIGVFTGIFLWLFALALFVGVPLDLFFRGRISKEESPRKIPFKPPTKFD